MKAKRYPKGSYAARAIDYAKRVTTGKIPACWQMRAACQRTQDDLKRTDLIYNENTPNERREFVTVPLRKIGELALMKSIRF